VISYFEGNEAERSQELLTDLTEGRNVALLTEAGTPSVSDPGQRLVAAAAAAGVRVEAIPGPSAALAALVASGLSADRFLFVGFPPREEGARRELFGSLSRERATMLFFEAPARVGRTLLDLGAALGDARAACLGRELTKVHEEMVRGSLAELAARYAQEAPRGECTLVVAGASAVEAAAEVDVEAETRRLLAEGASPKDVAARLAVTTGKPRRVLYQLALSLRGRP
jgi:16S rRNA (cytidine1402-2'-O)-methyltransferase